MGLKRFFLRVFKMPAKQNFTEKSHIKTFELNNIRKKEKKNIDKTNANEY